MAFGPDSGKLPTGNQRSLRNDPVLWLLGFLALFSGASLLAHILTGVSLRLAIGFSGAFVILTAVTVILKTPAAARRHMGQVALVGLLAGLAATVAYDVAKALLSQLDPSPYNPFEAFNTFGRLLLGAEAGAGPTLAAGLGLHVLNGTCFGIAYAFLLGRRGWLPGVAWGLGLELFQLTLYPGWLDIRFFNEFATISSLGHVVYGWVLGVGCRYGLNVLKRRAS